MAEPTLLPSEKPVQLLEDPSPAYSLPEPQRLVSAYRAMVVGRSFDAQATTLTKQGKLAVYPSSKGQEACQVGAAMCLSEDDWLFPTYRDSVALVARHRRRCGFDARGLALRLPRGRPANAPRWPRRRCTPRVSPTARPARGATRSS